MDEVTRQRGQARQAGESSAQANVDWFARWQVSLQPGEGFLGEWRDSPLVLLLNMLPPLLLAVVLVPLFVLTFSRSTPLATVLFALLLPLSFVVLIWLSVVMLRWYFRIYVLTNRRLIRREGIIWRVRNEVQLPKVQNASYSAAILQKWVGLGTVKVETASMGPALTLDNVRDALSVSQQILKTADEAKRQRALMDEEQVRRMLETNLVAPGPQRSS
ncbi:MAG: PH domain-containing protein [Anaerolineae bacterium]|nr:PH domain-containing protein [Anaerolineae bacterium]